MDKVLEGKVAIVTGAGSGIGRATALLLARAGAAVTVADLDGARAGGVAGEIEAAGGAALGIACDVAREEDVQAMVAATVARFGGLDILHNNAAASSPTLMARDRDIVSMDVAVWDEAFAVNLRGPMLGCKHAIPHMLARGGGAIVNTSSASGLVGDLSRPAYGASKGGLNALTLYVATLHGKQGIRCNAIAPGVMETPALTANVSPQQIDIYRRNHLTPRLGLPEDVAATVLFLVSPAAAFITGQIVSVDGGLLAHHPAYAEFLSAG
ncbi:SDR family NAD(P)-dependent oxidoreductase [Sphingomonas jatrophae]|uniref:NAD(P)-dependent dehydrogenase, short-chain alcohol dehydrogenase family n=1 Tax=Sphingomonas jatrophae TaxID=1166337 RepID=A0A1I6KGF3_9SPHN|nr:glucose 1-dehydrogenase [Sphingomonas jatrophae]SFR90287.1 NAD(P)-dependent dehydrogenase, short-chain alcohol dehydrogenase family [Sphingomonas jatrophae]